MKRIIYLSILIFYANSIFSQDTTSFIPQVKDWGTYLPAGSAVNAVNGTVQKTAFYNFDVGSDGNIVTSWRALEGGTNLDVQTNWINASSHQENIAGNEDIFLCSIAQTGNLNWATYFGGEGMDSGVIRLDQNDNIYLLGQTTSFTGISTPGAYQIEHNHYYHPPRTIEVDGVVYELEPERLIANYFIAKFSSDGELLWSTYFSGNKGRGGNITKVFIGETGVYFSGHTYSSEGITTPSSVQPDWPENVPSEPNENGIEPPSVRFVVKFSFDGDLIWGTYAHNIGHRIAGLDPDDNIYMYYDYGGSYEEEPNALIKLSGADGSYLGTIPFLENTKYQKIFFDDEGNTFLSGKTSSEDIGTSGTFNPIRNPYFNEEPFIEKYDANMQKLWGTYLTRDHHTLTGVNELDNISVSESGETFLSRTIKTDGLGTTNVYQENLEAPINGYALRLDLDGQLKWFTYHGGSNVISSSVGKLGQESLILFGSVADDPEDENIATENGLIPDPATIEPFFEDRKMFLMRLVLNEEMSVEEFEHSQVKVYPNPAKETITLQSSVELSEETELFIYDLMGREVLFTKGENTNTQSLDVSKLSSGVYFLSIKHQNKNQRVQFIKE